MRNRRQRGDGWKRRRIGWRLLVCGLGLLPWLCGHGEEVHELRELRVWGWHFDGEAMKFPSSVTVIDREAIGRSRAGNLAELLAEAANVRVESVTGRGEQGEVALRGFGEGSGLRALVVVNGQRMNRPDMGGVEWSLLPLGMIESVEVIRGGQTVLYGNHAVSGVILVTTRRGGEARAGAGVSVGSDGYWRLTTDAGGGAGGWYWDASVGAMEDDGYRQHSASWERSASGSVGYRWGEGSGGGSVTAGVVLSEGSAQFPGPLDLAKVVEDPRRSNNAGDEFADQRSGVATLQGELRRGGSVLQWQAGLQVRSLDWSLGGLHAGNEQASVTVAPRLRWGGAEDFWMVGLDAVADWVDFRQYLDGERALVRAKADLSRGSVGPYLFGQRNLGGGWLLSGGVRQEWSEGRYDYRAFKENQLRRQIRTNRGLIDNPDYRFPAELDPAKSYDRRVGKSGRAAELSLLWETERAGSVWLGYDRLYRYPVLDEAAAYQGFELAEPVNAALEPETGDHIDLGFRQVRGGWDVSATLFELRLNGEIAYDAAQRLNVNLADTRRRGLEVGLGWRGRLVGVRTQLEWVDARFVSGEQRGRAVPLVPRAYATSSLEWSPLPWLELALQHRWSAKRYQGSDFANELPAVAGFQRLDFRLALEWRGISGFIRVDNLLDARYAPIAVSGGYYPASGRQWRAGLRYRF